MNEYKVETEKSTNGNRREFRVLARSHVEAFDIVHNEYSLDMFEYIKRVSLVKRGVSDFELTQGMCQS
jgi:hypothetical protein